MAAIRAISSAHMILLKEIFASRLLVPCLSSCSTSSAAASSSSLSLRTAFSAFPGTSSSSSSSAVKVPLRGISYSTIRCAASQDDKKVSARFSQVQQLLQEAQERAASAGNDPPPKITLDHVTISFARSSGPGGQNVNKVNTKVDMRFNVQNAYWLSERIRERIMQLEKNRINKDGEIVISSTKTRSQKDNIEDALAKLQAIIDAASYVPPPPSEEKKKKIAKLAAESEQKRLKSKKALSDKKSFRRSRNSWD